MNRLARLKFRTKIVLGISCIVLFTVLAVAPFVSRMTTSALVEESKRRGSALAENLALRAAEPLLANDLLRLKNMVDELRAVGSGVVYAFILDDQGRVPAHTFTGGFPVELREANAPTDHGVSVQLIDTGKERIYDFAASVIVDGVALGTVRIGLSRNLVQQEVRRLLVGMAMLAGGSLAGAIVLAALFASGVTRRLNVLRRHAEEMVKGNLEMQTGDLLSRNCWEIMDCTLEECPAFGDAGRRCWYLAGTLCPECSGKHFPEKLDSCRVCPVYRENRGDELQDLAETFDVMALTIKSQIAELRQAEKSLTAQQQIMRTILNVTPDLVSLLDAELKYQAVNVAFADFVHLSVNAVQGKTDFDIYPPDVARRRVLEHRAVLETGERIQVESRRTTPDGPRWYHTVTLPVRGREGEVVGVLRSARDVTEIKSYQEQLIQAQKMESIGKLAGGVAHEINTPLGIILGYVQLMREDLPEGSPMAGDLAIVEKQTKVCRKIVADLLGFSRQAESAKIEMCFNNSVRETVSLVEHTFRLDKVRIVTVMDDRMPIIYGDPEKLKQVWMNLLTNARDAMPGGGVITLRTQLDTPAHLVRLYVADTGSGIAEKDLARIFDPFFSTKAVGEGTGLGLSVSFGIIEDHGGEIRVESPVPETFPRALPEGGEGGQPGPPGQSGQAPGIGPGTLFIVELPLTHEDKIAKPRIES